MFSILIDVANKKTIITNKVAKVFQVFMYYKFALIK